VKITYLNKMEGENDVKGDLGSKVDHKPPLFGR